MKIALIEGGPSTEAEVSRRSAAALKEALGRAGHRVTRYELGPQLAEVLLEAEPDVVFPIAHGTQGEDGCLQGLLEVLGLSYVGSDVRASSLGADKQGTKMAFRAAGIPVADDIVLEDVDARRDPASLLGSLREKLGNELIVKPVMGGSTIGISRLLAEATPEDLERALHTAWSLDERVLVESYVRGRELTVSVLEEEPGPRALAVTLIETQATDWYDFESKYAPGGSRHTCPAPLSEAMTHTLCELAVKAHRAVGARDLSRTDFILTDDDRVVALELNTLPGMTSVSLFPEAARAVGIDLPQLAEQLVRRAKGRAEAARTRNNPDLIRPLP